MTLIHSFNLKQKDYEVQYPDLLIKIIYIAYLCIWVIISKN